MTRHFSFAGSLFYYDGIQLLEARDPIGGHYVGVAVDGPDKDRFTYALFGVSPGNLQRFRLGLADLKDLIVSRSERTWFLGQLSGSQNAILAEEQSGEVPESYLPDDDLTLSGPTEQQGESVRIESQARNRLALEVEFQSLSPSDEHRIGATVLGGALLHLQSLVKNAYQKKLTLEHGHTQNGQDVAAMLDVAVPASPGSFRMILVPSSETVNVFNASEVERALDAVDYLLADVPDPEKTLQRAQHYSGRAAASLVRFLKFLGESSLSFEYAWTAPNRKGVSKRGVSRADAIPILEKLLSAAKIGAEKKIITGKLKRISMYAKTWGLEAQDGKHYSGKTREEVSLEGLVTGASYMFECEEELEEITGTGREVRTLYLSSRPTSVRG